MIGNNNSFIDLLKSAEYVLGDIQALMLLLCENSANLRCVITTKLNGESLHRNCNGSVPEPSS